VVLVRGGYAEGREAGAGCAEGLCGGARGRRRLRGGARCAEGREAGVNGLLVFEELMPKLGVQCC